MPRTSRIVNPRVFYPAPIPVPAPRKLHVPPKYVSFQPGVFNTIKYGPGVQLPAFYLAPAEDPTMGDGVYTTRPANVGDFLLHYGVEIPHTRAKYLSRQVQILLSF